MRRLLIYLPMLALLLQGCASQQGAGGSGKQTQNQAYLYDPASPLHVDIRQLDGGQYQRIYLRFGFTDLLPQSLPEAVTLRYKARYQLVQGYESRQVLAADTLQLQRLLPLGDRSYSLAFNLAKPAVAQPLLLVYVEDLKTGQLYQFDFRLYLSGQAPGAGRYLVFNRMGTRPLYTPFLRVGDTASIRSLTVEGQKLYLRQFGLDTEPALPPMAVATTVLGAGGSQILATYAVAQNNLMAFTQPGLYQITDDTTQPGLTVLVEPRAYPNLTRSSELLPPLTYMTTRAERARFTQQPDKKRSLDQFWLDVAGSRDGARRVIADYYENVELANRYFSDYRAGWKTDRGMVYIIFGQPSVVLKRAGQEEWRYGETSNAPELRFVFDQKAAPLGSDIYELRRSPDYDRYWYTVVDQWRKGIARR